MEKPGRTGAHIVLSELQSETSDPITMVALAQVLYRRRLQESRRATHYLPDLAWQAGSAVAVADHVLEQLETPWDYPEPESEADAWLLQLREGIDGFARMCWFLRFGYTTAAVALARRLFERWTYNLGSSTETWPNTGEDYQDYARRVWSVHESMLEGRDVGAEWSRLSELLHGRAPKIGRHAIQLGLIMAPEDRLRIHELALNVAELALRQVRGAIDVAYKAAALPSTQLSQLIQLRTERFPLVTEPDFIEVIYSPLDYEFVQSDLATTISSWGATYRAIVAERGKNPLAILGFSWMAIEERWCRAIDDSRKSFEAERQLLGPKFNQFGLAITLMQCRTVAELAHLTGALIGSNAHGQALDTAAAALDSAWALWLQDLDESMMCVRAVLEGAARARTHRTKPLKANKLEARGSLTTPHRWLEAAGWRRLAGFNRALSEFSHMQAHSRVKRARDLLTAMQRNASAGTEIQTARARALEEVTTMLAHEVAATLEDSYPSLAAALRESILGTSNAVQADRQLEEWLDRSLSFQQFDFGPAVLDESEARRAEFDREADGLS